MFKLCPFKHTHTHKHFSTQSGSIFGILEKEMHRNHIYCLNVNFLVLGQSQPLYNCFECHADIKNALDIANLIDLQQICDKSLSNTNLNNYAASSQAFALAFKFFLKLPSRYF